MDDVDAVRLRARVAARCEQELRALCRRDGSVEQDVFIAGLKGMRDELDNERLRALPRAEATRAIREIARAVDRADAALKSLRSDELLEPSLRDLLAIVDALGQIPELTDLRLAIRGRPKNAKDDDWEFAFTAELSKYQRRQIVQQFARVPFLGLNRPPSVRELAILSLFFDPEHGCDARRTSSLPPLKSPAAVIKAEMDAMRHVVKRNPLAKYSRDSRG
jgi:hypothetical protein